jgi:hypothetical protein
MAKYELEEDFSIAFSPPFGDSELTSILMSLDCIQLLFEAYEKDEEIETIRVIGRRPKLIHFTSDHLQNVVDRVLLFKKGDVVKAEQETVGLEIISDAKLQTMCDKLEHDQQIFVVCPIAGPELIAIVSTVELYKNETQPLIS